MSQGNPEFRRILDQLWEMHCRKGDDYGDDEDSLANVRGAAEYGVPPWLGAMLRANDKVVRIKQFSRRGTLTNEGVEDSFLDLASYAILALVLYREKTPPSSEKAPVSESLADVVVRSNSG